ncbi:MAG: HutD family protein [Bradyrhizobium sp.]|uniref:HutD/Ves family protein n=1 Tax=Bradyrhizobium sp. TaxID=376 RepID=UPI0027157305|nr:HutD family protein [Bradyrhizobium sp.]MDO9563576.1 HutD family protein [Bradyrhizobium sp.]MDP3693553.1 HutD family protein [Bradyrhizobium sp.]
MSPTASGGGIRIAKIDPAAFRHTPWKNGGGVTIDVAEALLPGFAPGGWDGLVWRFGRTAIVTPGPFSDLSGFDRQQMLVSGQGLVLETASGDIDVRQPFRPVRFAGETPIVSRLEAGPVEVVNLLGDRSRVSIDLSCLAAAATNTLPRGIHILYAAATPCDVIIGGEANRIAAGHALRIDADESFTVASRLGTAIVASIFFRPAATDHA